MRTSVETPGRLTIYFLADGPAGDGRRRWIRWWIRTLTRSRLYHVAVGYDGVVLNPTLAGVMYHAQIAFESDYPHLAVAVDVPAAYPIDLGYYEDRVGRPIDPWPTVVRWLRRGRGPWTADCVCVALECLTAAGVEAPAAIVSPSQLLQWALLRGFPCRSMRTTTTSFRRTRQRC